MKLKLRTTEPPARSLPPRLANLRRRSCTWRDGVGPGFATGVTEQMVEYLAGRPRADYCK